MSLNALRAQLALWRRRHTYRQRKLDRAHRRDDKAAIDKWERLRRQAGEQIDTLQRRIAARKPRPSRRARAVAAFAAHIGITEQPPGSNGNPANISRWQAEFGFGRVAWCGIACAHFLRGAGVAGVTSRLASVALIEQDARAGRAPFRGWTTDPSKVLRGDLVVIGGPGVHVEMVERAGAHGVVQTIGANTSPGRAGSQSNGGGVWRRVRQPGEIHGFALVNYPN